MSYDIEKDAFTQAIIANTAVQAQTNAKLVGLLDELRELRTTVNDRISRIGAKIEESNEKVVAEVKATQAANTTAHNHRIHIWGGLWVFLQLNHDLLIALFIMIYVDKIEADALMKYVYWLGGGLGIGVMKFFPDIIKKIGGK